MTKTLHYGGYHHNNTKEDNKISSGAAFLLLGTTTSNNHHHHHHNSTAPSPPPPPPPSTMRMAIVFILITFPLIILNEYYPVVRTRGAFFSSSSSSTANEMYNVVTNDDNMDSTAAAADGGSSIERSSTPTDDDDNGFSSFDKILQHHDEGPYVQDQYGIYSPKYLQARLPSVMIIGTQKAATSSIATFLFEKILACRPQRFDNEPSYYEKETHFFDRIMRYNQGIQFYGKRFEHCYNISIQEENQHILQFYNHTRTPYVLDATPAVLPHADRVYETYQKAGGNQTANVKFIVVLRDPVARELSVYNQMKDLYLELGLQSKGDYDWYNLVLNPDKTVKTFEEYVDTVTIPNVTLSPEVGSSGKREHFGMYAEHLKEWFTYFNRKQVLVISYEELKYEPDIVRDRVCDFLNIRRFTQQSFISVNGHDSISKVKSVSCSVQQKMMSIFGPLNEELYQLLSQQDGPDAEQKPFPKFIQSECTNNE